MIDLILLNKLKTDLKKASVLLTDQEARYLVDTYYQMQEYRKRAKNQIRKLDTVPENEPHELLTLFGDNFFTIEKNIKSCLEVYANSKPIGRWLMSICGIGPVISAGLMANIDISKVKTGGAVQRFAGLDPTLPKPKKGEKHKYNAKLKTLCWKIGESFVKVCNNPNDVYGKIYKKRKEMEKENNVLLLYKDQAAATLEEKEFTNKEIKAWYEKGMLPPGHIESRAKRYAVKIFLSHLFSVWYEIDHGELPPKPYALAILNHTHEIPIPNWH